MNPKISVVICTYNRPSETCQAIKALQSQDFRDWECVLIDNGCTDNSFEILSKAVAEDDRIRFIQIKRTYVANARNIGISKTNPASCYVMIHDDDDWLFPGALSKLLALADKHPEAVCAYGLPRSCDGDGHSNESLEDAFGAERYGVGKFGFIRKLRFDEPDTFNSFVVWCTLKTMGQVLVRREPLIKEGGFDPAFGISDDWNLWLRLSKYGPFVRIPEYTLYKRAHTGNLSSMKDLQVVAEKSVRLALKSGMNLSKTERYIAFMGYIGSFSMNLMWARHDVKRGKYSLAIRHLCQGVVRICRAIGMYLLPSTAQKVPRVNAKLSASDLNLGMISNAKNTN